jgi:hypothetical protein
MNLKLYESHTLKNVNEIDVETQMTKSLKGMNARDNLMNKNVINTLDKN